MKTRKEGSKARLLGLSCMALVLTAFGVTGVRADAADAKKAPPLVNLAEEKDVKVTVGENMDLKNADLLTDGDKYYLQHDATGNKEGNNWENYQEQGTEVTSTAEGKNGVWVQVDLGASYPLEVINLKRQVYEAQPNIVNGNPGDGKRLNGTKISYKNTAIVIGTQSQDNWETPKAPNDVRIDSKSSSSANISWAAEEPGCTYCVYVNGKMVWEGKEMNQTIQELTPLTTYQVYVTAVNERGIESLRSETVELVTMAQ